MADTILGVNVNEVYKTPDFTLGTVVEVIDKEFIFIKAGETFGSANAAIVINFENEGELLTQDNFENGNRIGLTTLRPSADEYLWLQVRGNAKVRVAASCAARARLYATTTAGVLDDEAGAYYVDGIRTTTDNGMAVAEVDCRLYYPKVGEEPGSGGGGGNGGGGNGGGGGGDAVATTTTTTTTAAPRMFVANIGSTASINATSTGVNILKMAATDILVDVGDLGDIGTGSNSLQNLTFPTAGTVQVAFGLYVFETSGSNRLESQCSIRLIRSGATVANSDRKSSAYVRGSGSADRGYITGIATYVVEAGDSVELIFTEGFTTAIVATVGGTGSFIQANEVLGATTVDVNVEVEGGGGGGSIVGWISPKDEYVADDLHKHLIDDGVEKEIIVEFHEGHSRVTTMQVLADIGTAVGADGTPHTTGVLGMFRGWFRRPGDIPTADTTDGSWYCARGIGDFEIQDPQGGHANARWTGYNPFEPTGPWATVTNTDGDTITHAAYSDEAGNTDDWRVVANLFEAESSVTAVGQCFTILGTFEVVMCVAFTAEEAEDAKYRAIPYIPAGSAAQRSVLFWGADQTEELPDTFD